MPDSFRAEVENAVRAMVESPALRRFFDPARYRNALNEVEYASDDGEVRRINKDDATWRGDRFPSSHDPQVNGILQATGLHSMTFSLKQAN